MTNDTSDSDNQSQNQSPNDRSVLPSTNSEVETMTTDTNNPSRLRQVLRIVATLAGVALGGGLSYLAFQEGMANTDLSMFAIATILSFAFFGGKLAWDFIDVNPDNYNVGLVEVKGPIQRDSPPKLSNKDRATADEVVEKIEKADNDSSVDALIVRLNTPGGEIVPSEDIKLAIEDFDGPVIGHAIDVCASGGYLIASACDEIICRNGSMIGSIGVIGSRTNYSELAEELGINYEQFTAGDYKDAGSPLKEMDDDERDYIQNLIDTHYENFVQTVADGRNMTVEAVKNTEAKVFLGSDALEKGLVDGIGTEDDVLSLLSETLSTPDVEVREFSDNSSALARLSIGAQSLAYSFGAGIADRFKAEDDRSLKMEYR